MEVLEKLEQLQGQFWTRLDELVEDIEDTGVEVVDSNREYIEVVYEDEETYVIRLGGTERTIVIDKIEEVY